MAPYRCLGISSAHFEYPNKCRITIKMNFTDLLTFLCLLTIPPKKNQNKFCSTNYIMLLKLFTFTELLHNFVRCDRIGKNLFCNNCC